MNSYGSVSLISHMIYKILHYLNFFPPRNSSDQIKCADGDTRIIIEPTQLAQEQEQEQEQEQDRCCDDTAFDPVNDVTVTIS